MTYEIANAINNFKIETLHVIKVMNGYGYAGKVPADIMYDNPTDEQLKNAAMGVPRFKHNAHRFPTPRVFETAEAAREYAEKLGYVVA